MIINRKKLRKIIVEELKGMLSILESKSIKSKLGRISFSTKKDTIYLDEYSELNEKMFKKFIEILKKDFPDLQVLKTSDITIINLEQKADWNTIEKLVKKI